jgi:NTP pyrophosphatase (non-canonical NTP hydrolase)
MNTVEYLLSCLAEECVEVAQRCEKLRGVPPLDALTNPSRYRHQKHDQLI